MPPVEWVRGLYAYHRWANRRLFAHALGRGTEIVERDLGRAWSRPSIRLLFAHMYGSDAVWLARWQGEHLAAIPGEDPVDGGPPRAVGSTRSRPARLR